ncbi:hypothetical protein Gotur_032949 [Gossypium turneri]
MAVFLNLDKPLVSQVMVDEAVQRVEYEALSTICFSCGRYGHMKEMCTLGVVDRDQESEKMVEADNSGKNDTKSVGAGETAFRLWMVVEKKSCHGPRDAKAKDQLKIEKEFYGSKLSTLIVEEERELKKSETGGRLLAAAAVEDENGNLMGMMARVKDNMDRTLGAGSSAGGLSTLGRETQMGLLNFLKQAMLEMWS